MITDDRDHDNHYQRRYVPSRFPPQTLLENNTALPHLLQITSRLPDNIQLTITPPRIDILHSSAPTTRRRIHGIIGPHEPQLLDRRKLDRALVLEPAEDAPAVEPTHGDIPRAVVAMARGVA